MSSGSFSSISSSSSSSQPWSVPALISTPIYSHSDASIPSEEPGEENAEIQNCTTLLKLLFDEEGLEAAREYANSQTVFRLRQHCSQLLKELIKQRKDKVTKPFYPIEMVHERARAEYDQKLLGEKPASSVSEGRGGGSGCSAEKSKAPSSAAGSNDPELDDCAAIVKTILEVNGIDAARQYAHTLTNPRLSLHCLGVIMDHAKKHRDNVKRDRRPEVQASQHADLLSYGPGRTTKREADQKREFEQKKKSEQNTIRDLIPNYFEVHEEGQSQQAAAAKKIENLVQDFLGENQEGEGGGVSSSGTAPGIAGSQQSLPHIPGIPGLLSGNIDLPKMVTMGKFYIDQTVGLQPTNSSKYDLLQSYLTSVKEIEAHLHQSIVRLTFDTPTPARGRSSSSQPYARTSSLLMDPEFSLFNSGSSSLAEPHLMRSWRSGLLPLDHDFDDSVSPYSRGRLPGGLSPAIGELDSSSYSLSSRAFAPTSVISSSAIVDAQSSTLSSSRSSQWAPTAPSALLDSSSNPFASRTVMMSSATASPAVLDSLSSMSSSSTPGAIYSFSSSSSSSLTPPKSK